MSRLVSDDRREEPNWVTYDQVAALHSRLLRRFGGALGLRDDGLLRSALGHPVNTWHDEQTELSDLAAAYAFGLAKNRAFVDGNTRVAFMTMVVFLRRNDIFFAPDPSHAAAIMMSLAAGEVSEASLARWVRDNWPGSRPGCHEPAAVFESAPSGRPTHQNR
jgi:death on curing protein